ncbi:MAG: hypothetical protein COB26_10265 [Piscirickettsiaceae bacterium]|nr:MAG: hypothetical protein COB26_10265 [Piscirickettsiaceae bacterium]
MSVFRHPKTQNERKADGAALEEGKTNNILIKGRIRSGFKGKNLPTERADKYPASQADRSRGKKTHSAARKVKVKRR